MLQSIHDKIKGWVAYVVLGAIAIVFVLWGINFTMGGATYAAKVDGREISASELRQTYQQELARVERSAPGQIDEAQRNDIKRRVIEDSVAVEALLGRMHDMGYRVSDQDLLAAMSQIQAFQVDGKFDQAHAVAVLKAQGRSIPEVEDLIRRQVQMNQLENALRGSSFTTGAEARHLTALTQQQRELAWVVFPAAHYAADIKSDDAAIAAYFEQHKGDYMSPETVDLRYVELSIAEMTAKVGVTAAQLQTFFNEQKTKNPEKYVQAEQRRVSHILLAVTDPKDDAAAKTKADAVYKRAKSGEDFGKLAKEFSEDKASAQQGGDLGWSDRKAWVKAFADAAFAMQPNDIQGPVKTQFGYHILKLDGVRAQTEKTFDESKGELEAQYRRNEAERMFNTAQDQLADAALQNGTDIDVVARKAGLPVKEILGFSRTAGGGPLGAAPKVLLAAFSQDVLDGRLSSITEVEKGRGVVLRASNHKLPQQKPLSAVLADVTTAWKSKRSIELAAAAGAEAVKRLSTGEQTLDAIAKGAGATPQAPKFVGRQDQTVPIEIRKAAFIAPKPDSKPTYQSVALANGDTAVFGFTAVRTDATPDTILGQLKHQYADEVAGTEAMSYALAARAAAKVQVNPQAID